MVGHDETHASRDEGQRDRQRHKGASASTATARLLEEGLGVEGIARVEADRRGALNIYPGSYHGATMARTMFSVNIDRSEPLALHDQVAAEIRRAIAEGEASPGERLPLAKDIAAVLGVNKNTVLRAMHILRDEGLVEFTRGRGITVSGSPQKSAVLSRVRDLVEFARRQGYRPEEVIDMIAGLP